MEGTIAWFNNRRGYGAIQPNGETTEFFVHHSNVIGEGRKILYPSQAVKFEAGKDDKDRPTAFKVVAGERPPKPKRTTEKPKATETAKVTPATDGEAKKKKKSRRNRSTKPLPRPAHWVLRCSDLKPALAFFKEVFGMRVLRHEENAEPCKITCNGRYNNAWSKTMVGYETEDRAYCLEVTYNYGVYSYKQGSGLTHIAVGVTDKAAALAAASKQGFSVAGDLITGPDGYKYLVVDRVRKSEPFDHVKIRVADVEKAKAFYTDILGMKDLTEGFKVDPTGAKKFAVMGYLKSMVPLFIYEDGQAPVIEELEGRHAISLPAKIIREIKAKIDPKYIVHDLQELQEQLGELVIMIIKDVDGFEHCLVNSELFDAAAKTSADFKDPDWDKRRAFIDERAGPKNKGKSS